PAELRAIDVQHAGPTQRLGQRVDLRDGLLAGDRFVVGQRQRRDLDTVELGHRAGLSSDVRADGRTSGTRGSGSMSAHAVRVQSRSGSYEQAIVRRSPARALR